MNNMRLKFIFLGLMTFLLGCTPKFSPPKDISGTKSTPTPIRSLVTPTVTVSASVTATKTPTLTPTLTPTRTLVAPMPVWSSNGLIAYVKDTIDPNYQDDNSIYISDAQGQNQINVFDGIEGIRGWDLSWSPSGKWLLFSEYQREAGSENSMRQIFNLWAVRSDGTSRHKIITTNRWKSISWAQNQDVFLLNCAVSDDAETEICIINPETGQVIRTGRIGQNPQFSPDGKTYAYVANKTKIYLVDATSQSRHLLFSASGTIPGFSWAKNQETIISAVINRPGCGNNKDGSSSIIEINIKTQKVKILREVEWSIYKLNLSPDQNYILSSWFLCVGNGYELSGVIGLHDDLVTWPLDRFVNYKWSTDGKYLVGTSITDGVQFLVDPLTGIYLTELTLPFVNPFSSLTDKERESYIPIFWAAQPAK